MAQTTSPTVADLLRHRRRFGLTVLAGPNASGSDTAGADLDRTIQHVAGVQRLADMQGARGGTLVVLLGPASEAYSGYEMDVAIRHAVAGELAGVVLTSPSHLPVTSAHLADRAHLPVLGPDRSIAPADMRDGPDLLLEIDRFVRGGASDTLSRAEAAIRNCQEAADAGGTDAVRAVLDAASESLGCRVAVDENPPQDSTTSGAVVVGDQPVARVLADVDDDATRVALPTIAGLVSRLRRNELNQRFAPALTRAELIVQIVLSERAQLPQLIEQAHRLDLPLQHTHVVVWVQVDAARDTGPAGMGTGTGMGTGAHADRTSRSGRTQDGAFPDAAHGLVRQRQLVADVELTALQVLHARAAMWHVATLGGDILLVCTDTWASDLHQRARADVEHLMDTLRDRGDVVLTAGMGTPQAGTDGIRQSAAEARVAAESAAASGRRGMLAETDATGLRRILSDLYSSPLSRNLLGEILTPLDALGSERSRVGVTTLAAVLDAQGSPTRAAQALHMHPNAVSYRLKWITETLGVDLNEPDTRFAVHMACKVRLLHA
ncbi:PucR family transcriptional regulator [Phytoactinopolyspora endophytica]|uniref:PucR family transcriptional regulator n=1 Tax=Phytoactinopolyspora endophytica TaxID=1642495 RepID=UPI00101D67EC|nr:helix-turn-helix domain-containing protein [Phytoactinopolyspora endophytica]